MTIRPKCGFHVTPHPSIIGKIDREDDSVIIGWVFDHSNESVLSKENIRIIIDDSIYTDFVYNIPRNDVSDYYLDKDYKIANCGFSINLPTSFQSVSFQYFDQDWITIFYSGKPPLKITNAVPQFIVVDNFYQNPDDVRRYALQQEFVTNIASHKGRRTTKDFNNNDIKNRFEQLLGKPITKWDYKWNGCFQYCTAEDPLVIHCDVQKYAALVYLTPNAPCSTGTSFYRHKVIKCQHYHNGVFQNGHYDFTPFELVDTVGNIYNRLVIFDAQLIHAASQYFGDKPDNSRLFQIFFFDI